MIGLRNELLTASISRAAEELFPIFSETWRLAEHSVWCFFLLVLFLKGNVATALVLLRLLSSN